MQGRQACEQQLVYCLGTEGTVSPNSDQNPFSKTGEMQLPSFKWTPQSARTAERSSIHTFPKQARLYL